VTPKTESGSREHRQQKDKTATTLKMGRLLNLVAPDPAAAVCKLPQPLRMVDKMVSGRAPHASKS
jgi:hypothetical protein